jgi:hypothetical protein
MLLFVTIIMVTWRIPSHPDDLDATRDIHKGQRSLSLCVHILTCFCLFLNLITDTSSTSQYDWKDGYKCWVIRSERSSRDLFWVTIQTVAWRKHGKPRKFCQDSRPPGLESSPGLRECKVGVLAIQPKLSVCTIDIFSEDCALYRHVYHHGT